MLETLNLQRKAKLDQLERILQSRTLHGSENLKSFLKYVTLKSIEESKDHLKEYTIATEVFGRNNDFSPRSDSVVRVQASRLRHKLQEYYATEGKSDTILIELPKGHYNPVFTLIEGASASESAPEALQIQETGNIQPQVTSLPAVESAASALKNRSWVKAFGAAFVLLAGACIFLAISNINLRSQVREGASENKADRFGPVWEPFLDNSDQTLLILSNPVVYRFTNPKDTDEVLNHSITLSPDQARYVSEASGNKFMIRHSAGRLVLSTDEYTGMGEAIGLARITNLFRSVDRGALLKQSRTVSPEDLKNNNIILLGSVWVNEWSGKLPIREDFAYTSEASIENRNPQPGEDREYNPRFDANGKLIEDYGLITVKPNFLYRNTVMVLAGIHSEGTEAAAEYVTNPDYLKNLSERLRQLSDNSVLPKYYQALLKVAVDNGMPTTISLVSVHELIAQSN
ncbi:MAG: hypothetical protein WBV94_15120 [Blastocatellia bacterium]